MTAVSRRCPLPVQLVHCVPSIRVAPAENDKNVDFCVIFKRETLPALVILKSTVSWTSSSNL